MTGIIEQALRAFLFTEHLLLIGLVCLVVLLGNLLGGLVRNIVLAHGGPIRVRPLYDRISFRLCMASELSLLVYALYYHVILIGNIEIPHLAFWVFTMLLTPLLALFGSLITGVIFAKEIEARKAEYRRRFAATQAQRAQRPAGSAAQAARRQATPSSVAGGTTSRRPGR